MNLLQQAASLEQLVPACISVVSDVLRKEKKNSKCRFHNHSLVKRAKIIREKDPGINLAENSDFLKSVKSEMGRLSLSLKNGSYRRSPLCAVYLPKPNGGKRLLLVHTKLESKIAEVSVFGVLKKPLHSLLNNGVSYCGIPAIEDKNSPNIFDAHHGIHQAHRRKWFMIKADIEKFFDNLNRDKVIELIKKHLPDDSCVPFFKDWVEINVENPEILKSPLTNKGIPQGSALSGLVANLYLQEFDEMLIRIPNVRLFRYADDLLIVSPDKKLLENTLQKAESYLNKSLGLKLNKDDEKFSRINPRESINILGLVHSEYQLFAKSETIQKWIQKIKIDFDQIEKIAIKIQQGKKINDRDKEILINTDKKISHKLSGYDGWLKVKHLRGLFNKSKIHNYTVTMNNFLTSSVRKVNLTAGQGIMRIEDFFRIGKNENKIYIWPYRIPRVSEKFSN